MPLSPELVEAFGKMTPAPVTPDKMGNQENPTLYASKDQDKQDAQNSNPNKVTTQPTATPYNSDNKIDKEPVITPKPTEVTLPTTTSLDLTQTKNKLPNEEDVVYIQNSEPIAKKGTNSGAGLDVDYGISAIQSNSLYNQLKSSNAISSQTVSLYNQLTNLGQTLDSSDPQMQDIWGKFKYSLAKDTTSYITKESKKGVAVTGINHVYQNARALQDDLMKSAYAYATEGPTLQQTIDAELSQGLAMAGKKGTYDPLEGPSVYAKKEFLASPFYKRVIDTYSKLGTPAAEQKLAELMNDMNSPVMTASEKEVTSQFMDIADAVDKFVKEAKTVYHFTTAQINPVLEALGMKDIGNFAWLGTKNAEYDIDEQMGESLKGWVSGGLKDISNTLMGGDLSSIVNSSYGGIVNNTTIKKITPTYNPAFPSSAPSKAMTTTYNSGMSEGAAAI